MKAEVVIGANFGDEGKGSVTASIVKNTSGKSLNVLTNGGAQRGHSILTDNGSFTFHHFGSGSAFGADNYFSEYFILNPMQFVKEYKELFDRGLNFTVFRNVNCIWSTPWDMMSNQIIEDKRGDKKHGSCGMGIWQTIRRFRSYGIVPFDTFMKMDIDLQLKYLNKVKSINFIETGAITSGWREIWSSQDLIRNFINDCRFVCEHTIPVNNISEIKGYDNLVFENGQGLLLSDEGIDDKDKTPSVTGGLYAANIISQLGNIDTTVHYVTRPYLTRHGGTNIAEVDRKTLALHEDRTNFNNEFQGQFRYGLLDISELQERVFHDFNRFENARMELDVTHCDEIDREKEFRALFTNVKCSDSALIN